MMDKIWMVNAPVFFSLSFLLLFSAKGYAVEQPIQFNHYKHTQELELECVMCHIGVRNRVRATLPSVEICIGCHEEAVTDSPEEEKIREYDSRGEEIPWQRLFRVPPHVFFSHRRHVTVAGLDCTKCHGDMAMRKTPPRKAPMRISMSYCLSCHRQLKASTDCVSCHR
ncbi:MAG: cytochrome c3 family protein [Deltaproteobacteria bacterium]|nr:cytochrome c3 family protein [Deltaproteobacteria bacterium]